MSVSSDKGVTYAGLTRRLDYVDRLDAYGDGAIRQSYFLTPIGEAQRILEDTGCVLTGWKMIEGEFYQLVYAPFGIKLRFISNAHLNHPILVLAYWEADPEIGVEASVLKFFGSSGRSVDGSATAEAQLLVDEFTASHPGVTYHWYPIFHGRIPAI